MSIVGFMAESGVLKRWLWAASHRLTNQSINERAAELCQLCLFLCRHQCISLIPFLASLAVIFIYFINNDGDLPLAEIAGQ